MDRTKIIKMSLILLIATECYAAMSYLDNGIVRVGIDYYSEYSNYYYRGGTITYLAKVGDGRDIINSYDMGRECQQSYYSGPAPFGTPHPSYPNWGWNPVAAGDVYGHPSTILQQTNDGTTIYVKRIPKQWAMNNVDSESIMEEWITLESNVVKVRCRLTNSRSDTTFYGGSHQELPALYTNPPFTKIYTYNGSSPFTNGTLTQIIQAGPPWTSFMATESWTALVDSSNFGVGLYNPCVQYTLGGTAGTGIGIDGYTTGYVSPVLSEHIDHNIVYEYEYYLIVGSLTEIRDYVYAHRPPTLPHWYFQKDRQHWFYTYATDGGFPINGHLRVNLTTGDPIMSGSAQWWKASDVSKLYIRAKYNSANAAAQLFWLRSDDGVLNDEKSIWFNVIPDNQYHTYVVHLYQKPSYSGTITQFRFDPVASGAAGNYVDIDYISAYPIPGDFNRNEIVDICDFAVLASHWGEDRAAGFLGDLDGDRKVGFTDLGILSEYWLSSVHLSSQYEPNIPSTVSGLVLWLDANDTSTITLSDGNVSQWQDKSGLTNHAAQATADKRPSYKANYINGKAAISFDGSNDCINVPHNNTSLDVAYITLFVVLKPSTPTVQYPMVLDKYPVNQAYLFFVTPGNYPVFRISGNNGLLYDAQLSHCGAVNSFEDWTGWYDGKVLKFFRNGWQAASTAVSSTGIPIKATSGDLTVGSGDGNAFKGDVAEIIMYNNAISDSDRQKIRSYLAKKYDLSE